MSDAFKLSTEQEFNVRAFEVQVKGLSQEQSHKMLVDLYRTMIVKETIYKGFLVQQLGVEKI